MLYLLNILTMYHISSKFVFSEYGYFFNLNLVILFPFYQNYFVNLSFNEIIDNHDYLNDTQKIINIWRLSVAAVIIVPY